MKKAEQSIEDILSLLVSWWLEISLASHAGRMEAVVPVLPVS